MELIHTWTFPKTAPVSSVRILDHPGTNRMPLDGSNSYWRATERNRIHQTPERSAHLGHESSGRDSAWRSDGTDSLGIICRFTTLSAMERGVARNRRTLAHRQPPEASRS